MNLLRGAALTAGVLLMTSQIVPASAAPGASYGWDLKPTGSAARFRGLGVVDARTAWLGGSAGTVLRTVDGGATWRNVSPPGAGDLLFRDVQAFDADNAVVLAIGQGDASRVYRTSDGGTTWAEAFRNPDPDAFYDCLDFFDAKRGLALSDPVGGKFRILATGDGGRSWDVVPNAGTPAALPGEFAFAASGTCLVTGPGRTAWFATGGGDRPRVFRSTDGGGTWSLVPAGQAPGGYRSGSAFLPGTDRTVVAVGPSGSDVSEDGGMSWRQFDAGTFDSVECARGACWASGAQGRAARLTVN